MGKQILQCFTIFITAFHQVHYQAYHQVHYQAYHQVPRGLEPGSPVPSWARRKNPGFVAALGEPGDVADLLRGSGCNKDYRLELCNIYEELRGLAVEFKLPIFTATQTTRSGFVSTDIGLEDTSESFGLPATADFMFALMSSEELDALNQMKVKQLKNRYSDPAINRSFIIGVDRSKMRLYDVEQKAQNIVDANQEKKVEVDPYDKFSDFKV